MSSLTGKHFLVLVLGTTEAKISTKLLNLRLPLECFTSMKSNNALLLARYKQISIFKNTHKLFCEFNLCGPRDLEHRLLADCDRPEGLHSKRKEKSGKIFR